MRHLNDEAAKTMKYGGLSETEAISLITINPARQLAIDNRVGSIEVGKDADLAIFDKHPLSNFAKVEKVYIDGELYFDRNKDVAERSLHDAEKKKLLDKEKERQRQAAPAARRPAA
jgi:imidazolonepropionase-like amidohydrolase